MSKNAQRTEKAGTEKVRARPKLGGWVCIFLLAWLFLAALVTGNNFLFIILGMILGLLIVSDRLARGNLRAMHCIRKVPEEIYAATQFAVDYIVKSEQNRWGLFTLSIMEQPPMDGQAEGAPVLRVRPGESAVATGTYSIASRGDKAIHEATASSVFPFGLAEYSRACCPSEAVLVFPQIVPVEEQVPVMPTGMGSTVERIDPFGSVPYAFRDYAPGDPYKCIDWKKTASTGKLITRVLGDEGAREIVVRLPLNASERAISRAASLVVHFAAHGTPVGLQGPGVYVAAGVGKDFTRKVLTMLARWGGPGMEGIEREDIGGMMVDVDAAGDFVWGQEGRAL